MSDIREGSIVVLTHRAIAEDGGFGDYCDSLGRRIKGKILSFVDREMVKIEWADGCEGFEQVKDLELA